MSDYYSSMLITIIARTRDTIKSSISGAQKVRVHFCSYDVVVDYNSADYTFPFYYKMRALRVRATSPR